MLKRNLNLCCCCEEVVTTIVSPKFHTTFAAEKTLILNNYIFRSGLLSLFKNDESTSQIQFGC